MSFDFFPNEQDAALLRAARNPSLVPEPGIWTNFVPGAAKTAMQGFAQAGRFVDLAGSIGPIIEDRLTGGTTAQDAYFQEHDAVFNRAVDYWTPKPGEVGTAGKIVGNLVSVLTQVAASPALAIGTAALGTGEDLVRAGIPARKAIDVGMIQGVGTGLGILMPIFGSSWATRALVAGAGANVAQGVITRAASATTLKGTAAAEQFNPWDAESIILDTLMGIGFGTLAHIGANGKKITLTPEQETALLVANQARHAEDTTAPGRPVSAIDQTTHAEAIKKAVDDVLNGRSADVEAGLRGTQFAEDPARIAAQTEVRDAVSSEAKRIVLETMAREQARIAAGDKPGFLRTPEDLLALRGDQPADLGPDLTRAVEIAKKPGFERTAEEKIFLDSMLNGNAFDHLIAPIEIPEPKNAAGAAQPVKPAASTGKGGKNAPEASGKSAEGETVSPLIAEAQARLAQRPDLVIADEAGNFSKLGDSLKAASADVAAAKSETNLFMTAAQCLLGSL